MAEWLKAHAWKACLGETLTRVRIPLSPPFVAQPRGKPEARVHPTGASNGDGDYRSRNHWPRGRICGRLPARRLTTSACAILDFHVRRTEPSSRNPSSPRASHAATGSFLITHRFR